MFTLENINFIYYVNLSKQMFPKVNKVLEYFMLNPTAKVHLREAARQSKVSPAGALKMLKKLIKSSLAVKFRESGRVLYMANNENVQFKELKIIVNLYSAYSSGLVFYLQEAYEYPEAIILFGSFAKGEDTEKSDVDIAVLTSKTKNLRLGEFEKKLGKKINIIEIGNLKDAKKEFVNGLCNGAVISGYLKVIE